MNFNTHHKLIITDRKNYIFLNELENQGYITISFERYVMDFVNKIMDVVCINNSVCSKMREESLLKSLIDKSKFSCTQNKTLRLNNESLEPQNCFDYRINMVEPSGFQISELLAVINNYFGKHSIEMSIIGKYLNKKIVVYDINYADVREFFVNKNFKEFN